MFLGEESGVLLSFIFALLLDAGLRFGFVLKLRGSLRCAGEGPALLRDDALFWAS